MTTPTPKTQASAGTLKAERRYQAVFETLALKKQTALIPFTLLGYPDKALSLEVVKTMIDTGASALELGIAFSDPMADGPVLQKASTEVLASGFSVPEAMDLLRQIRAYDAKIPIGLLVYYNVVLAYGIQSWFETLGNIGVDAVMVVDLPLEAIEEIQEVATRYDVQLVLMISPLTSQERIAQIAQKDPAFFYVVSRLGITGTHATYDDKLQAMLNQIKAISPIPACVGFGISQPEHVQKMKALGADGVIVGSAVIQTVSKAIADKQEPLECLRAYMAQLVSACQ